MIFYNSTKQVDSTISIYLRFLWGNCLIDLVLVIFHGGCIYVASFQGYKKSDEFIVTQYPLESTKEDFWRMVWDRNSPVIIVLTSVGEEASC